MNGDQSGAVLSKLRAVLSDASHVALPEITADTDPWTDFNLDIADLVSLEVQVEYAFGVLLPHHAMLHFRTVGEIVIYLADVLSARTVGHFLPPVGVAVRDGIRPA
jgi:acyl carrier protein